MVRINRDQEVTLTTVTPHRKVRIVGITPDHGLLRTLPERDAWAGVLDALARIRAARDAPRA